MMLRKIKDTAAALFLAMIALAVMLLPAETGQGISDGIALCLERVVPSVFPMMLICIMAVECGFAETAGRRLAPLSARLFRLPGEAAAAVLLSVTGGYPAGAKTVAELYECGAITRRQASRMMLFCFCSGPAFLIGMVGGLTGSASAGWLLMIVQAVVVVLLGVAVGRIFGRNEDGKPECVADRKNCRSKRLMSAAVVISVSKSASAVLQVCLYVIIFSAVGNVLENTGVGAAVEELLVRLGFGERLAGAVLPSLLEVTGGCIRSSEAGLPMIAFAVGFGGLSVHLQVLAIAEKLEVNKLHFFCARIAQGLLSAGITAVVIRLLPEDAVPASAQLNHWGLSGSPQGALVLVVMCAVCVLCLPLNGRVWNSGSDTV